MNARERFVACMRFRPMDRAPNWEMGYWAGALTRWHQEGLPRRDDEPLGLQAGDGIKGEGFPWRRSEPRDTAVHVALGFDGGLEKVDVNWGICPALPVEVLCEDDTTVTRREPDGTVVRVRKDSASLPHAIGWPVTDHASWEQLRDERLRPEAPGRFPPDWQVHLALYRDRDWPLIMGGPFVGVFSSLRTLLGFEGMMYAFYDMPDLVDDILGHLTELWLALFDEVLAQVALDGMYYWEDMSYKGGGMVSPAIFGRFLAPVYQRINQHLRHQGLDIILLDTDGNVWDLIPQFLEVGVTALYPFEVRAGMDVAEVRARYPRLGMMGGIDKNALAAGPAAIDAELDRIAPVIRSGGYVPACDHYVPPDVSWESFCYYRNRLRALL
jgi:hypothetical protein